MICFQVARNTAAVKANLDLLLKWLSLRFFETNPAVVIKGLEFVLVIFEELTTESYSMHDLEIGCFVPYLIHKIGDPKEPVRNSAKKIIEKIPPMYNAAKLFNYLMEGLKAKNSRERAG
jgi:cytoskeleton-associated protein 5